jgi:dolichol-phosphate mannosyltransferase
MICVNAATYNERDNIDILLTKLEHALAELDYRIIIVDDNSPDGTGRRVKDRQQKNDRIVLIERPSKLGLGTATKAGIAKALELGADRIIYMDADLSHPPEMILEMINLDYNLIIGSRYVPGGGIKGWNLYRKLNSRIANMGAHWITGLTARDTTGGFRCIKREVFNRIDLKNIKSEGYSFQIELLWHVQRAGLSIYEVPITFLNRTRGNSKISSIEVWRAMGTILYLGFLRLSRQR